MVPSSCCRNYVPVFLGRNPLFLPLRSGYCTVWQDTTSYALIPAPDTPYGPLLYRLIICCRQIQRHCESCCWKYCRDSDGWYAIAIFLLNTLDLIKECWANMDQGIQMAPLFCRVYLYSMSYISITSTLITVIFFCLPHILPYPSSQISDFPVMLMYLLPCISIRFLVYHYL